MNKLNIYLFSLTNKYLIINFIIISLFILFINFLELSRVISESDKNFINYLYFSFLKYPSILNEILPFVTIISVAFLIRNLINNNEFISMRNLGYSIIDIFKPISIAILVMGIFFLVFLNPLSVLLENKYNIKLNTKENSLYSIKRTPFLINYCYVIVPFKVLNGVQNLGRYFQKTDKKFMYLILLLLIRDIINRLI